MPSTWHPEHFFNGLLRGGRRRARRAPRGARRSRIPRLMSTAADPASKTLALTGTSLTLEDLAAVLRGEAVRLVLPPETEARMQRARALVDEKVAAGAVVYGLTTGFGKLKHVAIPTAELADLQRNLVLSHSVGCGPPLAPEEVRVAQILRLNGLVRGHSGIRVELAHKLVRFFDKGFVPVVPEQGSVGASGDLAPLAHMAAAYMGYGEAWVGGRRMSARDALAAVGEEPLELAAKEGLAIINGTEIMTAIGAGAVRRAANLSKAADAIGALTLEALFGSLKPFDARLAELRGHAGQRRTADNVRALLANSAVLASHAACNRVQDAYSLRCIPQIHGAFKAALEHVSAILSGEINSVTDNPVLFPDTAEIVSAGQFHGQPVSMIMDYLALSLCTLANVSERRCEQLVNPDLNGDLPAFLTPNPGAHSGFMIAQVAAAALASENKSLAHPASVDSVPTSANQEDHVSMGTIAARKARAIAANVEQVLAIEWLCAAQAREFHKELAAGDGPEAAQRLLRTRVPPLGPDRYLKPDLDAAVELVRSGALVAAVEEAVGPLAS